MTDSGIPVEPNDIFVPIFPPEDEGVIDDHMDALREQASRLKVTVFYFESYIAGKAMYTPCEAWWRKMAALCESLDIILVADESLLGSVNFF